MLADSCDVDGRRTLQRESILLERQEFDRKDALGSPYLKRPAAPTTCVPRALRITHSHLPRS